MRAGRWIVGLGEDHSVERQREPLAAGLDEQATQYRQCDRHDDPELGPGARSGPHLDPTTAGFDVGPHHVEPDAAPGHIGDEGGGRQAGLKGQSQYFFRAQAVGVDALSGGLGADALGVDTASIVGHGDDDLGAQLHGVQADGAVSRLAGRFTFGDRFDAVVDRVTDQVDERVGELEQDAAVHLRVRTPGVPPDVLALCARQVADRALQLVGDGRHRDHLRTSGAVLQIVERPRKLVVLGIGRRVDPESVLEHATDPQMR